MQTAMVIAIIAVAAAYLVWRRMRSAKGETPSCGCGCSGCPSSGGCGESAPDVLRPKGGAAGEE